MNTCLGIMLVGDSTKADSNVRPIDDFKKCCSININILVHNFKKNLSIISSIHLEYAKPSYPFHMQILSKAKKGCQDFYKALMKDVETPPAWTKWEI